MFPRHLCLLGAGLLLGGCLQRVTPEPEGTHASSASGADAGVSSKGPSLSCDEFFRRNSPPDGGSPGRGTLVALGADGGAAGGADAGPLQYPLDKNEIRRIIISHRSEVLACYDRASEQAPHLWGKVAVRFVIANTGEVGCSELATSTVGHPGLEHCVVSAATTWRFPQPRGGGVVMVTYPFVFRPVPPQGVGSPAPADAGAEDEG